MIRHKVEALNPAPWKKLGTQRGVGASGATGYLLCPLDIGEEGMVWSVCVFRLLPDAHTSELTVEYEKEEG